MRFNEKSPIHGWMWRLTANRKHRHDHFRAFEAHEENLQVSCECLVLCIQDVDDHAESICNHKDGLSTERQCGVLRISHRLQNRGQHENGQRN
jgi:hypothetical protein